MPGISTPVTLEGARQTIITLTHSETCFAQIPKMRPHASRAAIFNWRDHVAPARIRRYPGLLEMRLYIKPITYVRMQCDP